MTKPAKDIDINCVVTSFGRVTVTPKTLEWVNDARLARDKRARCHDLEKAAITLAAIKWHKGDVLERI